MKRSWASHTNSGTTCVRSGLEYGTLETVAPPTKIICLWNDLLLVFIVGNNLNQFILNVIRIDGLAADGRQGLGGLLQLAFFDIKTWRFWQDKEACSKDDSPKELNGNRNSI